MGCLNFLQKLDNRGDIFVDGTRASFGEGFSFVEVVATFRIFSDGFMFLSRVKNILG